MWMNISVSGHKGLSDGETTLYSSSLGTPALSVLGELTLGHLRYLSFPPKRQSFSRSACSEDHKKIFLAKCMQRRP